jgi:hypothetical protein
MRRKLRFQVLGAGYVREQLQGSREQAVKGIHHKGVGTGAYKQVSVSLSTDNIYHTREPFMHLYGSGICIQPDVLHNRSHLTADSTTASASRPWYLQGRVGPGVSGG